MQKKLMKLLSVALAIFLVGSLAVPARAATVSQITAQIQRTYSQCRKAFGRSFDGYCGTLTGYQLYYMGITATRDRQNGNEGFDRYCNQKQTSGGYGVTAYPAKKWTLQESLNHITDNGTKDVYNILVGFQTTKTSAGKKYGHSCVVHAIIGGRVYFMESYGVTLNGKYYREGSAISCTIAEFCKYYNNFTTFDGVIYFGAAAYADQCDHYSTNFEAMVTKAAVLRSQPCSSDIDESSQPVAEVSKGDPLAVVGVVENTEGEFWYQTAGEEPAYVPAESVKVLRFQYDDVTLEEVSAPSVLRQGRAFGIKGRINTQSNSLYTVRSQVFSLEDEAKEQVFATAAVVEDTHYDLNNSAISKELAFRDLTAGSYRFELAAVIGSYYCEADQLQVRWETVSLWNSDFRVTEEKSDACQISFDPCGGTASVNRISMVVGEPVGTLPTAQRGSEVFLGWYTQEEGGERITADYLPEEDTTVYARFSTPEVLEAEADKFWYVYADGITAIGCAQIDGVLYYFTTTDHSGLSGSVWSAAY